MLPDLSVREAALREFMDDPSIDPHTLERTYARFSVVNAFVSGVRTLYRRDIRPRARRHPVRMADIGTGGGDIPRRLLGLARRERLPLTIVAVDPDERAIAWAGRQQRMPGLEFRQASSSELAAAGERFDVVFSNHVLHHLPDDALDQLLRDSQQLVDPDHGLVVHSDIARGRAAYLAFAALTRPFASGLFGGTFIREDGITSIRRSYTAGELAARVPEGWSVRREPPARLELRWERGGHGG